MHVGTGVWCEVEALLLLHEAWVTLQHGNVLLNPFCQRLDRNYGISMLQKGRGASAGDKVSGRDGMFCGITAPAKASTG